MFDEHLKNKGTARHLTVHDSPASNGSAERANRTHVECALAMLTASGLPKNLWAEAILHSVWIRNRVPTRSMGENKTPYEKGTGKKPNLSRLHEWGSTAWVKKLNVSKLDSKVEKGRFVGFDDESKGYRIYWPEKKRVSIERDVYFNKDEVLQSNEVQIEGEWDVPPNSDTPQASNKPENSEQSSKTVQDTPKIPDKNQPQNPVTEAENSPNTPTTESQATNPPQNESAPTRNQHVRRNSLKGLQQFNPDE